MKIGKQLLSMILVVAMVLSLLPAGVLAATEEKSVSLPIEQLAAPQEEFVFEEPGKVDDAPVGDIIITDKAYRIQKNPDLQSYTILEYLGAATNVVIPSEYEGLPITRIAAYAFRGKAGITAVTIPQTVTRMEEGVFEGCTGLTYQTYEGGRYLGSANNPYYYYAGPADRDTAEVTIHADTKLVAAMAFRGCEKLKSVTVPEGVIQIGYGMLFGCDVEQVTLPFVGELGTNVNPQFGWIFGARSMGGNISYVPQSLKTVVITGGQIAQGAFYGVDRIADITLPYLGGSADSTANHFISYYWGADTYSQNILPASVKRVTITGGPVPANAFSGCTSVEELCFTDDVTEFGEIFQNFTNLKSIRLPACVTALGDAAFAGCSSLMSIDLPDGVISIGDNAFHNCSSLTSISLPEGVTTIGNYAFYWCTSLTSVTLPESLTAIKNYAFYQCSGLTNVTLPNNLTAIWGYAFYGCRKLTSITLPASLTSIGSQAFYNCSLYYVTNNSSLSLTIGSVGNGYVAYYAKALVDSTGQKQFASGYGETADGFLYEEKYGTYTLRAYYGNADPVTLPENINGQAYAIQELCGVRNVIVPEGVTSIGWNAFYNCATLTSITIADSVTSIGQSAFYGCSSLENVYINDLTAWCSINFGNNVANPLHYAKNLYVAGELVREITIPDTVFSLGSDVFYAPYALDKVTIPKSLQLINSRACHNSITVEISSENPYLQQVGGVIYDKPATKIISAANCSGDVEILAGVTVIENSAFYGCTGLTSIALPDGVTSIGSSAFYDCSSLESIILPDSVTSIGDYAFYGCSSLVSVAIPDGVTFISGYAFRGCSSLTGVTLPDSLTSIGNSAFHGCHSLTSIAIPATVTSIGSSAFSYCIRLTSIALPAAVTTLEGSVFDGCSNLTSITLPERLTSIGNSAFYDCTSLKTISIPSGVISIGESAFFDCSSLENITLPDSVTSVGKSAFRGCTSLERITLSVNVTAIGDSVFYGCSSLTDINLPDGLTSIAANAFYGCASLRSVTVPGGVTTVSDSAFYGCSSLTSVTLCQGVSSIGMYTFRDCNSLTDISLPNSLNSIGYGAFYNCAGLAKIILPAGLTTIGGYAFYNCSVYYVVNSSGLALTMGSTSNGYVTYNAKVLEDSTGQKQYASGYGETEDGFVYQERYGKYTLRAYIGIMDTVTLPDTINGQSYTIENMRGLYNVIVPEGVTSIGNGAFRDCGSLTSVTLPESLTSIGSEAFYACSGLTSLTIPEGVTTIGSSAFAGSGLTSITLPAGVSSIAYGLFSSCKNLTNVTVPEGVTSVGAYAFNNCISLTDIVLPESVTSIDHSVFMYCSNLINVTLPDNLTSIGNAAFYLCSGLTSITLPESLTSISTEMFRSCRNLTSITLPEGVTSIGWYAFEDCSSLMSINLPEGMTAIGDRAFYNCSSLTTVRTPNSVTSIGALAFAGCAGLTEVMYDGEENEWRHVMKANDWNEGAAEDIMTFAPNAGYLYETDEKFEEFYIAVYQGAETEIIPKAQYSGRPVTAVLAQAFRGNDTVTSVTLPETVVYIGEYAFADCDALVDIQFPEGLKSMQRGVLAGCDALQSLELPFLGEERAVGEDAYLGYIFGAYSYKENGIYLPENLTAVTVTDVDAIGDHAFDGCTGLESITLPDTLVSIGDYAFNRCSRLERLDLPEAVTSVGAMILSGCNAVSTVSIGTQLRYDGIADLTQENPLFGMDKSASRLKAYIVAEGNPDFVVDSGILYRTLTIDGVALPVEVVDAPAQANLLNYNLPALIVKIGSYAFAYNNTLRAMDLEYVRMIGRNAFYKNENLIYANFGTSAEVPEGVDAISYSQYVGQEAFMGCSSLQSVNLESEMLIGIGDSAFADCDKLANITLGKNVQVVGLGAFGTSGSGGSALENIFVHEDNAHLQSIDGVLYRRNEDDTLTLLIYPAMSNAYTLEEGKNVFHVPADKVTAIESYAFRMAQKLDVVEVIPDNPLKVGDYAFANSRLERVRIGENVISLGLRRGEGEYTVFADCNYLVAVEVDGDNAYYSSLDGVLFDKNQTRLIKYPVAKTGGVYELPDTVGLIASMAFKNNSHLKYVSIPSYVGTVGLEAFYGCTGLSLIFFDSVYAPEAVLENAFTTFDSVNESHTANPRTQIGYSRGYYLDGDGYGWSNYEDVYDLVPCEALPEWENRGGNEFYAVVVVDSEGRRIDRVNVTLTDPSGTSETVATGSEDASTGVAMFYGLFGATGMGFNLDFEGTYSLKVSDPEGEYFTYVNPEFYLDEDMRITYVTLTTIPSLYGTTCGEVDINTESAEINKAEFGYSNVELIDESLGFVEGNIRETSAVSEYVDISVIAYCDSKSGWQFVDANGMVLDKDAGLYQNGVKVCDVKAVQVQEDSVLFTFSADILKLIPEAPIEARITAYGKEDTSYVCATVLNIHVFDFLVTEDNVNLDTQEMEIDLAAQNSTLAKLFGTNKIDISLGKNASFGVSVDGSRVEMTLGGEYSKSKEKSAVGTYASYKEGYDKNHGSHNKNTYFFQFTGTYTDKQNKEHTLTYNVRFARGTEESNYFYYRCYVYEGEYDNEITTFYGAVNGLNDVMSKAIGAKTYRARVAPKAYLVFKTHLAVANHDAKKLQDIDDLDSYAKYIEAVAGVPSITNSHSFDVELSGKLIFEYDRTAGLKPVSSEIHGELYYTFKHNSQFVVWVIPVVLEVEVKVGGEVDIKLKLDEDWHISPEEVELTLSATLSAKVGVGCSVASLGVYGSVGTVFVLDFYPQFGIDSWKINGEIGAYLKVLWYTKNFTIAKFNHTIMSANELTNQINLNGMYLAQNYSAADLDPCDGDSRIVTDGQNIYKIGYVDASALAGYDSYNFRKLAVQKWDGNDWTAPVLIDDNGKNDAAYAIYENYIVYTQQGNVLDAESLDDAYAASANMVVKVADISDLANVTVSTAAQGEYYKYLSTVAEVDGALTAVWAENTDNDMFGVSPYNYIDAGGVSHVFETTANAIYMSRLVDGQWQEPVCVKAGLSAVTDIALSDSGTLCYIVDENGDLGDSGDRQMYSVSANLQSVAPVRPAATGSITSVEAYDSGFVYYLDSTTEPGLYTLEQNLDLPKVNMPEGYELIQDDAGNVLAVFYTALKTWEEDGTTVDGSAMYGVFRNGESWGQPVEINAFPVEKNVYISSFDGIYKDDAVMLVADFVDPDGQFLYQRTESAFALAPKLELQSYEVDYVRQVLNVTLTNAGGKAAQAYACVDGTTPVLYGEIGSGETAVISVSLNGINPTVSIFDSPDGTPVAQITDIDLQYSDMVPLVKQLLLGDDNNLLLAVKNTGNLANSGYVIIRPGNFDRDTLQTQTLLDQANAASMAVGQVLCVTDSDGNSYWVVKVEAQSATVHHFEIPLGEQFAQQALLTVYLETDLALEKGTAADNNITYVSYQACTGVLEEGETVDAVPELDRDFVELDKADVTIGFGCGLTDTLQSITCDGTELVADVDYTFELSEGRGTLTLMHTAFEKAGSYELTLTFAEGQTCKLTVSVPEYYTITWVADGKVLCETQVKKGAVPYLSSVPVRDGCAFAGWATNPAAVTGSIGAATEDTTYYALWSKKAQTFKVTWVFQNSKGGQITVEENYAYNALPQYKGRIPAPAGKVLAGWDKEIVPCVADAVYTAVYESAAKPVLTLRYPSLSFESEIRYNVYYTVDNLTDVVEMGLVTFDSRLVDGTVAQALEVIPGYVSSGSSYMANTHGIPAKKLGDALYFKVYAKLSDGSYIYSDIAGYHAVAYANTVLNNADSSPEAKALMVAMLNYGAAAQEYFGYKTESLMNAGLTEEQQAMVTGYSESMVTTSLTRVTSKVGAFANTGGLANFYPTVSFEGAFAINYYCIPSNGVDGDVTLYYWDAETYQTASKLTVKNAMGKQVMTLSDNGEYGAAVTGIAAKDLDEYFYVSVVYESDGTGYCSGVIGYSLAAYCKGFAQNDRSDMYHFSRATIVYGHYAKELLGK